MGGGNVRGFDAGRGLMGEDNKMLGVKNESLGCVGVSVLGGNVLHGGEDGAGVLEEVRSVDGCGKGEVGDEVGLGIGVFDVGGSGGLMNVLGGGDVYVGHGDGEKGEEVRVGGASLDDVGGSRKTSNDQGEQRGCDFFDVDVVHSGTLGCGNDAVLAGARSLAFWVDDGVGQSKDGLYDCGVIVADCDGGSIRSLENPIKEDSERDHTIQSQAVHLTVSDQGIPCHTVPALKPEFCMSDLVWGKVRSHPWWPGQIFDSSAASEKAKKYYKKDCYLIGYFGDKSFAWNDVTEIKPFWENFGQLEKQSNSVSFRLAVDCALAEISRRMQSGLACFCIPEDVYAGVKSQKIHNPGICLELIGRNDRDNDPIVASFEPSQLFKCVTNLAKRPLCEVDMLERVTAHAQLMAFQRWYHNLQFAQVQMSAGLMENEADALLGDCLQSDDIMMDVDVKFSKQTLHIGANSSDQNETSHKCKKIFDDGLGTRRKVSRLSVLMSDSYFDVPVVETDSIIFKRPREQSMLVDSRTKGKGRRVKSRLGISPSTPIETSESRSKILIGKESTSSQQMLSKLHLAAKNPFEGYNRLNPVSNFFRDFRNSNCIEYISSPDHEIEKLSGGPQVGTGTSELECRDSYWTDRIIQRIPEAQLPFEQFNAKEDSAALAKMGKQSCENYLAPTALILHFTDLVSVPSLAYLNEVFRGFGPIDESLTKVLRKSNSAKVVFSRRADAEKAFSSAGKYSMFGPSLVSYRLKYLSSRKSYVHETKRKRKRTASTVSHAI